MSTIVCFDAFRVDLDAGQVYKHGVRLRLREQSFRVLEALLERSGEVVTREQLQQRLWPGGVFVDFENGLNTAVGRLREALGDSADEPRYVETLPRRGYRFLAPLTAVAPEPGGGSPPDGYHASDRESIAGPGRAGAIGGTASPSAYREYVQGRRRLYRCRNDEDLAAARLHFEHAAEADPRFARAHVSLAELCWFQAYLGLVAPKDAVAEGILHAVRALELDGRNADAHALLAQFHKQIDYNWSDVGRELEYARGLDPGSTLVRGLYVVGWLTPQGRIDEGIAELEGVLARDPDSMWTHHWLGIQLILGRRWDRLLAHTRAMIDIEPASPWGYWMMAAALRAEGRCEDGIAAARAAVERSGGWPFMLGWLGLTLGVGGRAGEACAVLERLHETARTRYVPDSSFAWVYLGLGDVDAAFEWLDRAVDRNDQFMMPIRTYAFLDPVRRDPRFAALLRKMKLGDGPLTV